MVPSSQHCRRPNNVLSYFDRQQLVNGVNITGLLYPNDGVNATQHVLHLFFLDFRQSGGDRVQAARLRTTSSRYSLTSSLKPVSVLSQCHEDSSSHVSQEGKEANMTYVKKLLFGVLAVGTNAYGISNSYS